MKKENVPLDKFKELLKKPSHNLFVPVYHKHKERRVKLMKSKKKKYTLNQIGDALFMFIKTTNERFDRIENHLDQIEHRLDYIVSENKLKDIKNK